MHPFTGLACMLPASLLALRLVNPYSLLALLALPLALLLLQPQGAQRLRQWSAVVLPLALGLLLVHGRWLDGFLGSWVGVELVVTAAQRLEALSLAARLWLRVAIVLAFALLWLSTTTPDRLMRALFASRLPAGAAYLLASPLLLVEQLKARLAAVAQAQAARGVDVHAAWFKRWRSVLALTVPLVVWTLSDVGERAAALDSRAFRSRARRTTLDAPVAAPWERALMVLAALCTLVITGSFLWL
jgi:energy-coupling factor transport system permease protein